METKGTVKAAFVSSFYYEKFRQNSKSINKGMYSYVVYICFQIEALVEKNKEMQEKLEEAENKLMELEVKLYLS